MPNDIVAGIALLPELKFVRQRRGPNGGVDIHAEKVSAFEVCPKCATRSFSTYDHRSVTIRDEPLRRVQMRLIIVKRRFRCPNQGCRKVFTEPVPGIIKGKHHTERFSRAVREACEDYCDLKRVKRVFRVSSDFVYKAFYRQLQLRQRMNNNEFHERVAIDEHGFGKGKIRGTRRFVTMIVDESRHKLLEVADGRSGADVASSLAHIPGRERVRWVSMDLSDPYKKFAKEFFPNAQIVADKFHVLRLLQGPLMKYRRQAEQGKNTAYLRLLLLGPKYMIPFEWRERFTRWLRKHETLHEVYRFKEKLSALYRMRSAAQANLEMTRITDSLALTLIPELRTLRKTLMKWRIQILNYWTSKQTNARVEGFNNKAKLIKRRAYGYISFNNYRLRLLNACGG